MVNAKINGNCESVGVEEIREAINGTAWPIIVARGESEKVVVGLNGEESPFKTELDGSLDKGDVDLKI